MKKIKAIFTILSITAITTSCGQGEDQDMSLFSLLQEDSLDALAVSPEDFVETIAYGLDAMGSTSAPPAVAGIASLSSSDVAAAESGEWDFSGDVSCEHGGTNHFSFKVIADDSGATDYVQFNVSHSSTDCRVSRSDDIATITGDFAGEYKIFSTESTKSGGLSRHVSGSATITYDSGGSRTCDFDITSELLFQETGPDSGTVSWRQSGTACGRNVDFSFNLSANSSNR